MLAIILLEVYNILYNGKNKLVKWKMNGWGALPNTHFIKYTPSSPTKNSTLTKRHNITLQHYNTTNVPTCIQYTNILYTTPQMTH